MAAEQPVAIKIFYCYAHKDKVFLDELERHMEALIRSGQIITWGDRTISPGIVWKREIDVHLNSSDIILLLLSPNFMSSDYCYSIEMKRAFERHSAGEAYIIPIILRPVVWKETPIGELQVLPSNGKAITTWHNRDEAFQNVVLGILEVVHKLLPWKLNKEMYCCPMCASSGAFPYFTKEGKLAFVCVSCRTFWEVGKPFKDRVNIESDLHGSTASSSNFFILLGLNPADPWDETKFEQALATKRREWQRKSLGIGHTTMEARYSLALIPEILRVMKDPAQRSIQATAALKDYEAKL